MLRHFDTKSTYSLTTHATCQMGLPYIWTLPSSVQYLIILHNSDSRYTATYSCHHFLYVYYLFLFLCLRILIVTNVLFCIFCFHHANWHSSASLTEDFPCFFLSCKTNARV
jgi:hypothetical protein